MHLLMLRVIISYCYVVCLISIFLDLCVFFFFKQKTAYEMRISDWSSDVCSSDLERNRSRPRVLRHLQNRLQIHPEGCLSGTSRPTVGDLCNGQDRKSVV